MRLVAAPLTPCARLSRVLRAGAAPRGTFPPACKSTSQPFTWSRAEIRGTHPRPSPDRRGLCSGSSPTPRWALGTAAGLARSPHPSNSPSRAYLSWRCTHQKQLEITPLGIAPKGPGQSGRVEARKNRALDAETRRAFEPPNLLAGGEETALCCADRAQGSRPGRRPRPPRPSPPPPRAAAPARTPAPAAASAPPRRRGGNAGLGHSGRSRLALATAPPPRRGPGRSAQQPLRLRAPG